MTGGEASIVREARTYLEALGATVCNASIGQRAAFAQALSKRGLLWAVGLSRRQNVYSADIGLAFPVAATGRRRQYHMPDRPPVSAEAMLSDEKMAED